MYSTLDLMLDVVSLRETTQKFMHTVLEEYCLMKAVRTHRLNIFNKESIEFFTQKIH